MRADDANHPFVDVVGGEEVANFNSGEVALVEAQVAALVADEMIIDRVDAPRSPAMEGIIALRGWLHADSAIAFPRWLRELNQRGYTPMLQADDDAAAATILNGDLIGAQRGVPVVLRIYRGVMHRAPGSLAVNILLYAVTWISTLYAGALYSGEALAINSAWDVLLPANLVKGLPFALTLLGILTAHELGHYFAARYHKVDVTLPYFIPMPFVFGTMGAFIMMREPISNRRKLFDIGVAGPLAGLVLAIPLLFYGLGTSTLTRMPTEAGVMMEGNSLLYLGAKYLMFGQILPNTATGMDVLMSPVTFAAWIGLLVTAINLLPVGQLDGGHAIYAMLGAKARWVNLATLGGMALLGVAGMQWAQNLFPVLAEIGSIGWFVWILLLYFMVGPYHPPPLDDISPIGGKRMVVGVLLFVLFLLIFAPATMRIL
jgi:membrane-associated protease RseP (regulator of RpoE activity)